MHFINKDRHFKFARILSKYHLLPTSPRNRCGFSNLCSCSRPSHERCWSFEPLSPCLFLPFTPLLEMIRRHTCCALRTDLIQDFHHHLNSIEPSNQFTLETESAGQLNMEPWEIHWHNCLQKTNTHIQIPRFQHGGNLDRSMRLTEDMRCIYKHISIRMTLLSRIRCI